MRWLPFDFFIEAKDVLYFNDKGKNICSIRYFKFVSKPELRCCQVHTISHHYGNTAKMTVMDISNLFIY